MDECAVAAVLAKTLAKKNACVLPAMTLTEVAARSALPVMAKIVHRSSFSAADAHSAEAGTTKIAHPYILRPRQAYREAGQWRRWELRKALQ